MAIDDIDLEQDPLEDNKLDYAELPTPPQVGPENFTMTGARDKFLGGGGAEKGPEKQPENAQTQSMNRTLTERAQRALGQASLWIREHPILTAAGMSATIIGLGGVAERALSLPPGVAQFSMAIAEAGLLVGVGVGGSSEADNIRHERADQQRAETLEAETQRRQEWRKILGEE